MLEGIRIVLTGVWAIYAILWALPGTIIGAVLGLGDSKRIVYIDTQLSKDVKKLHANFACMMPYKIMNRFMIYSITFPFIKHRMTTKSLKFKLFMWLNCIGFWGWILVPTLKLITK
ncbi:hypothetical protein KY46_12960 [Photobacterium halotolerans]|uniref:Uncharacterized protein n=1 Tax=Photobacterium halotolerans TaxID=265726 RepID=A0A0F5VD43_9GAMM|nr:hypothetical protein KY46_12960 [Photobacterium halotolerans]